MALPKSARTIEVDGVVYKWMLGKTAPDDTANVVVEFPNGKVMSYREQVRYWDYTLVNEGGYVGIPVTPEMVRQFIRTRLGT